MTAMIGASAVAASLLVMVEPSGTGLEGVWAALAVLMVGRLATLGWRFQSADGPLPPTHLQQQQLLQDVLPAGHASHSSEDASSSDSGSGSSKEASSSSSSRSSSMAVAEVTAPLLLLNNSVEGSSLRSSRRLAASQAGGGSSRRVKQVHNGVCDAARGLSVPAGTAAPAAVKASTDSSTHHKGASALKE